MDEYEKAKIEEADKKNLSTGDTGVIYLEDDGSETVKAESAAQAAKKKRSDTAASEYAAWADSDGNDPEFEPVKRRRKKRKEEDEGDDEEVFYGTFFDKIVGFFKNMSGLDYLVMGTGILVLLVAIITGVVYSSSKATQNKIAEFSYLGEKMQTVGTTGSSKLVAVADAKKMVAEIVEDPVDDEETLPEYVEKEDDSTISVTMTLTSVKKDLKIKFINAKSKKLVANHEFKVEIVDARNKKFTAVDDDKDGIIYLNNMEPGKTSVSMCEIDDKGITYSRETVSVTVKENIDYKKIDVSDEVKKESEINAKKEDTAAGLATEGSLTDTVEWVESTKTALTDGYAAVSKNNITDPAKITPAASKSAKAVGVTPMVVADHEYASKLVFPAPYVLKRATGSTPEDNNSTTDSGSGNDGPSQDDLYATATAAAATAEAEATNAAATAEASATNAAATNAAGDAEATAAAATNAAATNAAATNAAATSAAGKITPTPTLSPTPSITPTPSVSPKASPKDDKTTPLKDKQNNQLYIKNSDGKYVEAKYADYYTAKEFFKKVEPAADDTTAYKYTGWQFLGNETYFFDKNGNKVTGEQVIQGAKYNFDSTGALMKGSGTLGIDVSKWNGNINWTAVKNSGVSFVIIRCGYRGSSTGVMVEDPKFKTNIKGATDAGLKVGIYFFSQAITDVEAVEEASMTIGLIKNYKISYPVFLDVEDSGGRGDRIDSNTRTAVIKAYCETLKNSGYTAGVYANKSWLSGKMNVGSLSSYKIWLAQYNTQPTYSGKYDMWQYSSKGSVSGINGNTDMNLSYLGY